MCAKDMYFEYYTNVYDPICYRRVAVQKICAQNAALSPMISDRQPRDRKILHCKYITEPESRVQRKETESYT